MGPGTKCFPGFSEHGIPAGLNSSSRSPGAIRRLHLFPYDVTISFPSFLRRFHVSPSSHRAGIRSNNDLFRVFFFYHQKTGRRGAREEREGGVGKTHKAFSPALVHTHAEERREHEKRNRNKAPVMSHLIFNLRRICRIALPRLLFFSLQWNCWTLFVDLNFPVHAGIHSRRGGGWGRGRWWISPVGAVLTKRRIIFPKRRKMGGQEGEKTRRARETVGGGGGKNRDHRRRVEFPARRHFIPLLAVAVFFFFPPRGSFCSSIRALSNPRIWIYRLLSSCVPSSDSMRKGFPSRVLSSLFCINCSIKRREELDLLLFI